MAKPVLDLTPRFLPDLLQGAAAIFPHRTAVDFMGAETSYAQLWEQVQKLAAGLQQKGLQKGDRVALMLPNCPAYLQFYFATLLAGGVVVNVNPLYSKYELQHILNDSDPAFFVTVDVTALVDKIRPLLHSRQLIVASLGKQLPLLKALGRKYFMKKDCAHIPEDAWLAHDLMIDKLPEPVEIDLEHDVALLQYTGGTTGLAKAAMLSHANLSINARQCRHWFASAKDGEETALAVIPFFHAFALTSLVNLSVLMGTTIIALPRFDLKQVLQTIHKKRPTIFPAVPTIYAAINNAPDIAQYNLRSVTCCVSGGAPLPQEVKDKFEALTGCSLVEGYGLSEASPVVCANPLGGNATGSIGFALPGTELQLLSLENGKPVPQGEKGELCVRGPQVMRGYWNQPLETANVLRDGWLHTGDVATMDADGRVFIVDRIKDMILNGGYNVYPRNIEDAAYRHGDVLEAVCAGVPDALRGEAVKLWVYLKPDATATESGLKTFLKDYLSPVELPKQIIISPEPLPKTLIGKLSRKDLLEREKKA